MPRIIKGFVVTRKPLRGNAYPVVVVASGKAEGGNATPVYVVSQAELDTGAFSLIGNRKDAIRVVQVTGTDHVAQGAAMPVFPIEGSFV